MQVEGTPVDIGEIGKLLDGNIFNILFFHQCRQTFQKTRFCFPDPAVGFCRFHIIPSFMRRTFQRTGFGAEILKKYTMVIVLVFVVIMFSVNTKGVMLLPQNVNNLVAQNAYVFILATGMLFCILTGGNIDLSVGSVVCFVAAVGGKMMVLNSMNPYLTMIVLSLIHI